MLVKNRNQNKITIGIIIAVILLIFIIMNTANIKNKNSASEETKLKILLNGESTIKLEVYSDYIEFGAKSYANQNEINDYLVIDSSNVNTSQLGTYQVVYTLNYNEKTEVAKRTIIVEDTTAPTISLKSNQEISITIGENYIEPGYIAIDNYDGDITNNVVVENNINTSQLGTYSVTYTINDSSGNITSQQRMIHVVDNTIPIINLNGDSTIYIEYPNNYVEPGFSATDKIDGNITNKVTISSNLDTTKLGTYKVTYFVANSRKRTTVVTRTIIVQDTIKPMITGIKHGDVVNHDVTISFTEGIAFLNGKKFESGSTVSNEGIYTLIVTDTAGNQTTIQFTILKTAPTLEVYSDGNVLESNGESANNVKLSISLFQYARYLIVNDEKIAIDTIEENKIINLKQAEDGSAGFITMQNGFIVIATNDNQSTNFTISIEDITSNISNTITFTINKIPTNLVNFTIYSPNTDTQAAKVNDEITLEFETEDSSKLNNINVQILGINANVQETDHKYIATIVIPDTVSNQQVISYTINYQDQLGRVGHIANDSNIMIYKEISANVSYSTTGFTKDNVITTITTSHLINIPNGFTKINNTTYQKEYQDNTVETISIVDIAGNTTTVDVNFNNILKITNQTITADKVKSDNTLPSYLQFIITFNRDITIETATDFRIYYEYSLDNGQTWIPCKIKSTIASYSYKSLLTYSGMLYLDGVKIATTKNFTILAGTEIMHLETSAATRLKEIYDAILATTDGSQVYCRNVIGIVEGNVEVKYPLDYVIYSDGGKTVSH